MNRQKTRDCFSRLFLVDVCVLYLQQQDLRLRMRMVDFCNMGCDNLCRLCLLSFQQR
jgi:hypothetical protein